MPFPPLRFLLPALVLAAMALASLSSCKKEPRVEQAAREKILLLGNGAEPKALDPHLVSSVGDSNILRALFEGLTTYHPVDDALHHPGVAERWEPNEDFTEWTFFLRQNARWSNGDLVTAHDFDYAYRRILHPNMGSPYASMLYVLENAKEYSLGNADWDTVGVNVVDDFTLTLSLNAIIPYFPDLVKHTTWYPVHRATIEEFGIEEFGEGATPEERMTAQFTKWQRPGNHVGNGPFMLDAWRIGAYVKVVRNPHYWDAETVNLNGIHFFPLDNLYAEERAFRDGGIHITYTMPDSMISVYRDENSPYFHTSPYLGTYFYRCNITKPPMDNPNLRRALAFAVDRKELVEHVTQGGQEPAYGFTYPLEGIYEPPHVLSFDPEKAREYLRAAGYTDGSQVPEFVIKINTSESHKAIAIAIQDMWKRHLGITRVKIENQEWKVFQDTIDNLNYQIARYGWIGDFIDPTTFLDLLRSDDTNNKTGWANEEYDRLVHQAKNTADLEQRRALLFEAEEILLEELPIIPLYWYTRVFLMHPSVKNWNPLLLDNHPYKYIDLVPTALPAS